MIKKLELMGQKIQMYTNSYILHNKKEAVLFDPGGYPTEIFKYLKDNNLDLKYIILTHAHFDHILSLDKVKNKYPNAIVCIGENEKEAYKDSDLNLLSIVNIQKMNTKIDRYLKEGDVLTLNNMRLEIYETPGHTKGSICIYFEILDKDMEEEVGLISGDTIFRHNVGRTDLPTGNLNELRESIHKIKQMLINKNKGNIKIYPGHDKNTDLKTEINTPVI